MKKIFKFAIISSAFLLFASSLCSCFGLFGGGNNNNDNDSSKIGELTITADKNSVAVGDYVELNYNYTGSTYSLEDLEYFVTIGKTSTRLSSGVASFEYEVQNGDNLSFWAKMCNHNYNHDDNKGDLISNILTVSVHYLINNEEDLKNISGSDKIFYLNNDINMGLLSSWEPIETFNGELYGNGYKISGLKLSIKSKDNVGLISVLNGKISNLVIDNVNISGSGSANNVGAIVGTNNGEISDCRVSGSISSEYSNNVGGLIGLSNSTKIFNNVNDATITSYKNVGGIVGKVTISAASESFKYNTNNGYISGFTYVGGIAGLVDSVRPSTSGYNYVYFTDNINYAGGIAGSVSGMYQHYNPDYGAKDYYVCVEISDCSNNEEISGGDATGGIIGYGYYVESLTACTNIADIYGNNYVGGFIGCSSNTETSNLINNNKVTGKAYIGGIAGYTGTVKNCKNNGQIVSTGTILEDSITKYCVGGIAGYCEGAINCVNNSDVILTESGINAGGIAGYIYCKTSVDNNTNNGIIQCLTCDNVGGIAGRITLTCQSSVGRLCWWYRRKCLRNVSTL